MKKSARWTWFVSAIAVVGVALVLAFVLSLATRGGVFYERHFVWLFWVNAGVAALLLLVIATAALRLATRLKRGKFGSRLLIKLAGIFALVGLLLHGASSDVWNRVFASIAERPGKIFGVMTPYFLFHVNHEYLSRRPAKLTGNWRLFLNVLNIEAENGVTVTAFRETLYGPHDPAKGYDETLGGLYVQVLRPLCWAGLLVEHGASDRISFGPRTFIKTPLWRVALQLDTDSQVRPATRH